MPLSDHEQRLLEQMERALYAEDPKFADALRKSRSANLDRKGMALGIGGILAGLAVLVAGVATQLVILGVVGFVVMLGGAFLLYRAVTRSESSEESGGGKPKTSGARLSRPPKQSGGGFMGRLEERWQQRKERGQF